MTSLKTISNIIDKIATTCSQMSQAYGLMGSFGILETLDAMGDSFKKLKEPCNYLEDSISTNFDRVFRYYNKEMVVINNLAKEITEKRNQYINYKTKLAKKKETQFNQKSIELWQIQNNCQYSKDQLLKDKGIAFSVMFPGETQEEARLNRISGYYLNKMNEEYHRLNEINTKDFMNQCIKFSSVNSDIFSKAFLYVI